MQIRDLRGTYGSEYPVRASTTTMFIAHHSEVPRPVNEQGALAQIANIDTYHKTTQGWPGFAYHGAVWGDLFFKCKDWNRMGYHSAGMDVSPRNGIGDNNDHGVAVVWLGNYSTGPGPSDQDLETMGEVYRLAMDEIGRNLTLVGHQDVWATACPGEWWSSGKHRVIDLSAPKPEAPDFTPREVQLITISGYLSGDVVRIEPRTARIAEANRVRQQDLGMEPITTP